MRVARARITSVTIVSLAALAIAALGQPIPERTLSVDPDPARTAESAGGPGSCAAEWLDTALDDGRIPVRRAAMAWTGSEVLIWGGELGYRFHPETTTWQVMSNAGVPTGYGAASAWTGSELLVWGGTRSSATKELDPSGARYVPATDSWNAIGSTGTPAVRRDTASAWTGTTWVVWGGRDAAGVTLADGASYSPTLDLWSPVTATGAPTARYGHTITAVDGKVLLFGGRSGGTYYADAYEYDPDGDAWTPLSLPPGEAGRTEHVSVWTGDYLLIYGGRQSGVGSVNTGWRYHAATRQWSAMSLSGAPTGGATTRGAWSGTHLIVWSGDGSAAGSYDPASDTWSPVTAAGAPSSRSDHSIAWAGDRLMVWGGGVADGATYDPILDSWTPTDPVLATRAMRNQVAVWTGSETLFWGGQSDADHAIASGYRYSPATDAWASVTPVGAPSARRFHSGVWTGAELIVWGGQLSSDGSVRLDDGARYDPATDAWSPMSGIGTPEARTHHMAVWTGTEMIVWGGWIGTTRDLTDTGGRYDPVTDTWDPVTTVGAPVGRRDLQAVWTGTTMIVWGGGVDLPGNQITYPTSGAAYDPATDSWSPIADASTILFDGRMMAVTAWTGSEMVVWSGLGDPVTLDDGARYDPATDTWSAMAPAGAPSDRRKAVGVWTGGRLVVYGGQSGDFPTTDAYLNDGGIWHPVLGWDVLPVEPALGPRSLHAGAWAGDRLVAFGGQSDGGVHNAGGVLIVDGDSDGDGICDSLDNCPAIPNSDQLDTDFDGFGSACDVCPTTPDPDQIDSDGNGVGDVCSRCSDPDGDGACDWPSFTSGDVCPNAYNPDQSGRKLVLSGSPFDGREVTRSYLRSASDDAPLVVYDGDLAVEGTRDLFNQRPLDGLELTSLGAAATAGPAGFELEDIYPNLALFTDQDATLDLFRVSLEGGAPPNAVQPVTPGFEVGGNGTKIVLHSFPSEWAPCQSWFYPSFAVLDTGTGSATCYGVDLADQSMEFDEVSGDESWYLWTFDDYNAAPGSGGRRYAVHFETGAFATLVVTEVGGASNGWYEVRGDGQAILGIYWDFPSIVVRSKLVDSAQYTYPIPSGDMPESRFSDQGNRLVLFDRIIDPTSLYLADMTTGSRDLIGQDLFDDDGSLGEVRFTPGETHFAFASWSGAELYVSPAVAGGPATPRSAAGGKITTFEFSPDGQWLYFAEERGGDLAAELWRTATSGGAPTRVGPTPAPGTTGVVNWTYHHDRLILYGSFEDANLQLYTMTLGDDDIQQFTVPSPTDSISDYWTDLQLGVVARLEGSTHLFSALVSGGALEALTTPGAEESISDPQFAEDGSFLIYDADIAGADRETVIYFAEVPDQDSDGILDPCDCAPHSASVGQSPGIVDLRFADASTLGWNTDGVSSAWTVYRGDLASLPVSDGLCMVEGLQAPSYFDPTVPPTPGDALIYLIAGEAGCVGTGEVAPRSDGTPRNVACP